MRREAPHPLVEDVDDGAARLRPEAARANSCISTKGARRLVSICAVPAFARHGQRLVALEHRGVVDEAAERPERRRAPPATSAAISSSRARSAASATARPPLPRDLGDQRLRPLSRELS